MDFAVRVPAGRRRAPIRLALLFFGFAAPVLAVSSCNEGTVTVPVPTQLRIVAGDAQQGAAGTALAAPLVTELRDAAGNPVTSQPVTFAVIAGGGSVSPASAVTDASGRAGTMWTLGTDASQPQRLEVRSSGLVATADADAVAGAAANVVAVTSGKLNGTAGAAISPEVAVRVTDRFGNPVPGAEVNWSASDQGIATPARSFSDASGIARTTWQLGYRLNEPQVLLARAAGASDLRLEADATAPPNADVRTTGDAQRGEAGTQLIAPLEVIVLSPSGQPLRGVQVSWSTGAGHGSLSATAVRTDSAGRALARWTLGDVAGNQTASATVLGRRIGFGATAEPGAAASLRLSNTSIALPAGSTQQLSATPVDRNGNVTSGTVTWTSAAPAIATVSVDGSVRGVAPGSTTARATTGSITAEVTITVTGATVSSVTVTPNPVSLRVAQTVQLEAVARSSSGDVISARAITWSSSAPAVATVSNSGWVTGLSVGTATISASIDGVTGGATVGVLPAAGTVVSIAMATSASIVVGDTFSLTLSTLRTNGTYTDPPTPVTFTSSNPAVATVTSGGIYGIVIGRSVGTTTITVTVQGVSRTAEFGVMAASTNEAPKVVSHIADSGVIPVLAAWIDPNGRTTTVSYEYSSTPSMAAPTSIAAGVVPASFTPAGVRVPNGAPTNLLPGRYYYRIVAVSDRGTTYSNVGTFDVNPLPTPSISVITYDTLRASVQMTAAVPPFSFSEFYPPAVRYEFQRRGPGETEWGNTTNPALIDPEAPPARHEFRVRLCYSTCSPYSTARSISTVPIPMPGSLSAGEHTSTSVLLTWGDPSGGRADFDVRWRRADEASFPATNRIYRTAGSTNAVISALTTGVSYIFQVRTAMDAATRLSAPATTSFTPVPPRAIRPVVLSSSATSGLIPTLDARVNPNGHETTVQFEYDTSTSFASARRAPGARTLPGVVDPAGLQAGPVTVPNLLPAQYFYRVLATNVAGTTVSAVDTFRVTAPAAPILSAATGYDTLRAHARLIFTPASGGPNNAPLVHETERRRSTDSVWTAVKLDSIPGTGFINMDRGGYDPAAPGSVYVYRMRACYAACGPYSTERSVVAGPVPVPTIVSASVRSATSVLLFWRDPVARRATFFEVRWRRASETTFAPGDRAEVPGDREAYEVAGLTTNADYVFTVRTATTWPGGTTLSAPATATARPVPVSTAPIYFSHTITSEVIPNARAIFDPNGTATTVTLEYSTDSTLTTGKTTATVGSLPAVYAPLGSQVGPIRLTSLTPARYYFRFVATNAGGVTSSPIDSFTVPDPPTPRNWTLFGFQTYGATAPGRYDRPFPDPTVIRLDVQRRLASDTVWATRTRITREHDFVYDWDDPEAAGATYVYRVRHCYVTCGTWSNESSITTAPMAVVGSLTATPRTVSSVLLRWADPFFSTGTGSPPDAFEIRWRRSSESTFPPANRMEVGGTLSESVVGGLAAGTTYVFEVRRVISKSFRQVSRPVSTSAATPTS